jgi:hypothetical protein
MPGGTNLPVLGDLGRGSQTPYPYDAYPHRIQKQIQRIEEKIQEQELALEALGWKQADPGIASDARFGG